MAVKLKIVPQAHWEILREYLNAEGVVLVPESNTVGIQHLNRAGITDEEMINYDFGGESDVWIDIAQTADHYAIKDLCYPHSLTQEDVERLEIDSVAYGTEDGTNFYVQTACNQEHFGQECGCLQYGETFTAEEAKTLANQVGKELNLKVNGW